ncbi:hypothetical protein [Caballeronia sordidicola]|jgi:hypothetical protein|uniref:Uncharacterized protein n=1 Tax=Caballeronia sordidicola TaxID=196367 RepID=A0A226WSY4_CABSO|nr:hypothetical protein [Caballeronia sordidicola]OXC74284.1 hypothetical protein BSU04_32535 [Caballeronia sordidicola]
MKTGRREFLATASLAVTCMRTSWPAQTMLWSPTLSSDQVALGHALTIVFDEHVADSRAFAVRSRAMGARVVPLGSDLGVLWFERLIPLASSPGNTIAGLTTHASAFLLTRFAQGIGLRVAQRTADAHAGPDTLVMWQLVANGARTCS